MCQSRKHKLSSEQIQITAPVVGTNSRQFRSFLGPIPWGNAVGPSHRSSASIKYVIARRRLPRPFFPIDDRRATKHRTAHLRWKSSHGNAILHSHGSSLRLFSCRHRVEKGVVDRCYWARQVAACRARSAACSPLLKLSSVHM